MADSIDDAKRALRAELRQRRRIRTSREKSQADAALAARLDELTARLAPRLVAAYLSTPDEPDTRVWLRAAAAAGIRILLPVSRADGLLDWAGYDGEDEEADLLGMPTPTTELEGPMAIDDADLILVPAAAVDRSGMRMGWGRGYFDKTLGSMQSSPPVYAVIFDDELLDSVPRDRHDMPVHGVVTPSAIVDL